MNMNVKKLLLNDENQVLAGTELLGKKISRCGKKHLWEERDELQRIDVIVLHYISAVEIDPQNKYKKELVLNIFHEFGVSSHYLIGRRGEILQLVPEEKKAWHCGGSIMPAPDNRTGVNAFSIGIELLATHTSGFTRLQYNALGRLCSDIESRFGYRFCYVGHDQIAGERAVELGLRTVAKVDPGSKFDWDLFYNILDLWRKKQSG